MDGIIKQIKAMLKNEAPMVSLTKHQQAYLMQKVVEQEETIGELKKLLEKPEHTHQIKHCKHCGGSGTNNDLSECSECNGSGLL